ncbi:MAG: ComF family protein [Patescibacteria group bacterium]
MRIFGAIIDSLFPARCIRCEKNIPRQEDALCSDCLETITLPNTLFCGTCGARLPAAKKICHRDTPYILGSIAEYEDPTIKKLIHALKFKRLKPVSVFLGNLLVAYVENLNPPFVLTEETIIIPLPLSKERLRERGFNQAALIAKTFAENVHLPMLEDVLIRTRHSKPQSQTENVKDREENVHDAFHVVRPEMIAGKKLIVIDDVTTTGATLRSASKVLKQNGAKEILALTIAR